VRAQLTAFQSAFGHPPDFVDGHQHVQLFPQIRDAVLAAMRAQATLRIEVRDTGPGIAADVLPHVFDRFYRAGDSTGSGLGLPIARSLVEAHGGTIGALAPAAGGTTVAIDLPLPG
jgi:signal transduction histidine kinase